MQIIQIMMIRRKQIPAKMLNPIIKPACEEDSAVDFDSMVVVVLVFVDVDVTIVVVCAEFGDSCISDLPSDG